jgi:hypothetical protein
MYILIKTVKTYLWIKATAVSSSKRANKIKENGEKILIVLEHRAIKICPAVILAARRTDNVIGRIICLTVSIMTINWDSPRGVLKGTRWLKKWFVLLKDLKITKEIQNGKARHRVNSICAEKVKIYGRRPKIFVKRIIKNSEVKKFILPFLFLLLSEAEISNVRGSIIFL